MSGADLNGRHIRKGATDAVVAWVTEQGGTVPGQLTPMVEEIARSGGTPLVVADGARALGVVHLKDIVKGGIRERFDELRRMGIKTIMITGDNRLTAATIADEAGVDDFLAEATPEAKLELIKEQQADGRMVAMTGDGTNDAPALAQADVGVTMNTGTQAAREAGNMIDLDSNPTKLIEIVEVGKQLLITRGALTTFSIANDVAKYFAILPAMFAATYAAAGDPTGPLDQLNIMRLGTPLSAIMSAVIFNALIIPLLVPLALRGVRYRPVGANALLRRNVWLYGFGGIIAPVHRHQAGRPRRPQPPGRLTVTTRGTLRVYLGMAPGAGKTYAMLGEGQRRKARGSDVVVAYVETYGRLKTEEMLRGLEVVPRRTLTYRGATFTEMDLDAVLARRPQVALVDELAHTNVPGSKHDKRWQDVEELLDAGITVISTVNVQHLESLNDVVERITGVKQRERVPDEVVRRADQVELVDITPEALRRRMAHGNIYPAEKIDAALTQLLPHRQPDRPPRARAAVGRRTGRRRPAALPHRARHHPAMGSTRAHRGRADRRARRARR